jgi:hypothetical protein
MHKFETTDIKQARRLRITQFNGRSAAVRLGEMTIKASCYPFWNKSQ